MEEQKKIKDKVFELEECDIKLVANDNKNNNIKNNVISEFKRHMINFKKDEK